jgi:hypothetical protein
MRGSRTKSFPLFSRLFEEEGQKPYRGFSSKQSLTAHRAIINFVMTAAPAYRKLIMAGPPPTE